MNQRIQELIKQAEKYAEEKSSWRGDNTEWRNEFEGIFKEKFAELIVRECADVILEEMKRTPQVHDYWGPYWDGLDSAQKMITKHFGVEL
ncbi:MAG: hypothetical protein RIR06_2003 [Bacteroidota bacterium]|jgi:hypothetical protein